MSTRESIRANHVPTTTAFLGVEAHEHHVMTTMGAARVRRTSPRVGGHMAAEQVKRFRVAANPKQGPDLSETGGQVALFVPTVQLRQISPTLPCQICAAKARQWEAKEGPRSISSNLPYGDHSAPLPCHPNGGGTVA